MILELLKESPRRSRAEGLDVVFVGAFTRASALAFALATLFRRAGTTTALGGPHARAFPEDSLRFFDFVIQDCDQALIGDLLRGHFDPPAILSSGCALTDIPGIEERMVDISASAFYQGRPRRTTQRLPRHLDTLSVRVQRSLIACVQFCTSVSGRAAGSSPVVSARMRPSFATSYEKPEMIMVTIPAGTASAWGKPA